MFLSRVVSLAGNAESGYKNNAAREETSSFLLQSEQVSLPGAALDFHDITLQVCAYWQE